MSDFNVLERIFGFLSSGTTGAGGSLEQTEDIYQAPRRTDFGMTYGSADGKRDLTPFPPYSPGQDEGLAGEMGIASDDFTQLSARNLIREKQIGPASSRKDRQRIKDYLER